MRPLLLLAFEPRPEDELWLEELAELYRIVEVTEPSRLGDAAVAWVDRAFSDEVRAWSDARPDPTLLLEAAALDEVVVERLRAFAAAVW